MPRLASRPPVFAFPARSGKFYRAIGDNLTTGALTVVADRLYAVPIIVPRLTSFDQICCDLTAAAGVGTSTIRLGIYVDNGAGYPGGLVLDTATDINIASGQATGAKTVSITQALEGLYWLVLNTRIAAGAPTVRSGTSGGSSPNYAQLIGCNVANPTANTAMDVGYYVASTYGDGYTLPNPYTGGATVQAGGTSVMPLISLRAA